MPFVSALDTRCALGFFFRWVAGFIIASTRSYIAESELRMLHQLQLKGKAKLEGKKRGVRSQ